MARKRNSDHNKMSEIMSTVGLFQIDQSINALESLLHKWHKLIPQDGLRQIAQKLNILANQIIAITQQKE
jgi:hypothetical protein